LHKGRVRCISIRLHPHDSMFGHRCFGCSSACRPFCMRLALRKGCAHHMWHDAALCDAQSILTGECLSFFTPHDLKHHMVLLPPALSCCEASCQQPQHVAPAVNGCVCVTSGYVTP
jgi:hypothetical protein